MFWVPTITALALFNGMHTGLATHEAIFVNASFDFFHRLHSYIIPHRVGHL